MRNLSDKKKEAILSAAARVFAGKGYHRALVDDVARAAGVGKGTVYRYFRDKEDLFFSIIDHGVGKLMKSMERAARSESDPRQALRSLFEAMAEFIRDNKPLFKLLREIKEHARRRRIEEYHRFTRRILAMTEKVLKDGIRKGIFRKGDVKLWATAVVSIANSAYIECPRNLRKKTTDEMMRMVFFGIGAERETRKAGRT